MSSAVSPALAAARVAVLPDDDLVEVAGRHPPELAHVLVAPVPRRRHDRDAAGSPSTTPRPGAPPLGDVGGHALDEVAERLEPGGVVRVVEEHLDAVEVEQVQPAGRLVDRGA